MRRLLLLPLIALAVALPFVESLVAQQPARKARKVALLVGPKEYLHDFTTLKHLDDDVTALAVELRKGGFDEVVVLTDTPEGANPATRKNILAELDRLLSGGGDATKAIRKDDVVLLALSGHGQEAFVDGKTKDTFFAPIDGKKKDPDTLVKVTDVLDKVSGCGCRTLVLADMCRDIYDPNKGKGVDTDNLKLPRNAAILFGCESTQQSFVNTDLKHSLFTYAVLEVLRESNKAGQPLLWSELVAGVEKKFDSDQFKKLMGDDRHQSPVERKTDLKATALMAVGGGAPIAPPVAPPMPKAEIAKADPKPGEEREFEIADGVKMKFCWIPKGKATLGSPETETARQLQVVNETEHEYEEKTGFWMGKYEVTQAQWTAVMGSNPSYFCATGEGKKSVAGLRTESFPVERVSFDDICGMGWRDGDDPLAGSFLAKVNSRPGLAATFGKGAKLRLPHEDEWEYACRGGLGNKRAYYLGDSLNSDKANCKAKELGFGDLRKEADLQRPAVVGTYASKAPHPWELCDMSGNVWEWCESKYSSDNKLLRGGSWDDFAIDCRAAKRFKFRPSERSFNFGFRLLLSSTK